MCAMKLRAYEESLTSSKFLTVWKLRHISLSVLSCQNTTDTFEKTLQIKSFSAKSNRPGWVCLGVLQSANAGSDEWVSTIPKQKEK
jgi:hypothetical protein